MTNLGKIWKFNKESNAWNFCNRCEKGHTVVKVNGKFLVVTLAQFAKLEKAGAL